MTKDKHVSCPVATRAGKLWDRVDCYILDDGRRVIAQRGILRALRNAEETRGHERGDLCQYLARLPSRFEHLTSGHEIRFSVPQEHGGVIPAIGREPSWFVDVLRAYAGGLTAGELHPSQVPMAHRAMDLLCLLAGKAIGQLVDEACGVQASMPPSAARPVTAEGVAVAMVAIFRPLLTDALAPLYGRLAALEQQPMGGVVGVAVAGHIKKELLAIGAIEHRCGKAKSVLSARTKLDNRLRGVVGWAGTACSWERLPAAKHGDALRELDVMRRTAEGIAEALGRERQMPLKLVR